MYTMNIYLRLIILIIILFGLLKFIHVQIKSIQKTGIKQKEQNLFKDESDINIPKKYALIGVFIVIIIILSTMFYINFETILYQIIGG